MTKVEATKWLKEFLNRVDTQDNRGTAHPIQFLLQRRREVVVDGDYHSDKMVYYHHTFESGSYDTREEAVEALKAYGYKDEELKKEIEEIKELYIGYYWETDQAFLTEDGVGRHLEQNRHNLKAWRDYVVHSFRNPEMAELFLAIRAVAND